MVILVRPASSMDGNFGLPVVHFGPDLNISPNSVQTFIPWEFPAGVSYDCNLSKIKDGQMWPQKLEVRCLAQGHLGSATDTDNLASLQLPVHLWNNGPLLGLSHPSVPKPSPDQIVVDRHIFHVAPSSGQKFTTILMTYLWLITSSASDVAHFVANINMLTKLSWGPRWTC